MKISVFGATGMAGGAVVTEALDRGHLVAAVSRRPGRLPVSARLTEAHLDIGVPDSLDPVLAGSDVAVLAVRTTPGDERLLAPWTTGFLDAAARTTTRVIVIGGAAPLSSPHDGGGLVADDTRYVPARWRASAQGSLDQLHACARHTYDGWAYLSPPAVFEAGPRTGRYRRGTTLLLTDPAGVSRISSADLAIAVLDEVETPGEDPHFTVVQMDARPVGA